MTYPITPVILAGGSGTRLWPVSRQSYPKQFCTLIGNKSLFQQTALRLRPTNRLHFAPPITVTHNAFRFTVAQHFQHIDIDPGPIPIEPSAKNTAPAILAACFYASQSDPDAVLLICPSDHAIADTKQFHDAILAGCYAVAHGQMVTFGIKPSCPNTGYGYLHVDMTTSDTFNSVVEFIEKPDLLRATEMVKSGDHFWNAGIFLFRAKDMIAAFEHHAPQFVPPVRAAVNNGTIDLGFFRLDAASWDMCDTESIDFAIMEQAPNLSCVPFAGDWSDLGEWDAIMTQMTPDDKGVAVSQHAHAIDCENTLLLSHSDDQEIVGLGLTDIIAVAMPDAVLVAHKTATQNVKQVVAHLKSKNIRQATAFPKDHRPWGWFETLALRDRFHVKRILVHPNAALSLQSHHHRSEHWIVVQGTAKVTLDHATSLISEGQSIYIPLGSQHRLENPGKLDLILIEVQTGGYLAEDDIIR